MHGTELHAYKIVDHQKCQDQWITCTSSGSTGNLLIFAFPVAWSSARFCTVAGWQYVWVGGGWCIFVGDTRGLHPGQQSLHARLKTKSNQHNSGTFCHGKLAAIVGLCRRADSYYAWHFAVEHRWRTGCVIRGNPARFAWFLHLFLWVFSNATSPRAINYTRSIWHFFHGEFPQHLQGNSDEILEHNLVNKIMQFLNNVIILKI